MLLRVDVDKNGEEVIRLVGDCSSPSPLRIRHVLTQGSMYEKCIRENACERKSGGNWRQLGGPLVHDSSQFSGIL